MKVPIAYLAVVAIWSTTPLGIVWSSESVSPTMAVLLRMLIAAVLSTLILITFRIKLPLSKEALKLYAFSSLGVFGGMIFGYMAARHVSSGLISLVFGFSPLVSGLLAQRILNEPKFSPVRLLAFFIALVGLLIVCWDKIVLGSDATIGIVFILLAMFFFSLSAVLVKSVTINIHPIATTLGALYVSVPLFALTWFILDGNFTTAGWTLRSVAAIAYLGIFGSLVGFIAYFFILQKLKASSVALVTLITPVFAISLGATLNNEQVTANLLIGASCVVLGLSLYHWGEKWLLKRQLV